MGFFSKIFKEISRPFKQAEAELERVGRRTEAELERAGKNVEGFFKPELPPLPTPQAPPATRITGQASDEIRRRQRGKVSGRRKTIVTGELSPAQVGKKTLLGR